MAEKNPDMANIKAYPEDAAFIDERRAGIFNNRQDYIHYLVEKERRAVLREEAEKDEGSTNGILSREELEVRLARSGYLSVKDAEAMRRQMGGRQQKEEEAGDEKEPEKPPDRGAAL